MRVKKVLLYGCGVMAGVAVTLAVLVYALTYHPRPIEPVAVLASTQAPILRAGQKLRILSWNVQYLAGKNQVFWYETAAGYPGPVAYRPSAEDLARTLSEVARIITEEKPDIVLLQELDEGSKRTDYADQLGRLLERLPPDYGQRVEAFYHRARYVPHPRIRGAIGMKLAILSKYRIREARRYQLPLMPQNLLSRQFYFKRALLEARLPVEGGPDLVVVDTHFDAWTAGTDTSERQAQATAALLARLDQQGCTWCLGGDFNILPPGPAYSSLPASEQAELRSTSDLAPLFERYQAVPSLAETGGGDSARWFTHWRNRLPRPDRTYDFLFFPRHVSIGDHYVRQRDPGQTAFLRISDHFPVLAEITLPTAK